ncbi:MAG: TPM domain-containing protein, partial [Acidobacteria bacterium]|nr:TPM domain-containing protein [Acidobacteriota bacterium]
MSWSGVIRTACLLVLLNAVPVAAQPAPPQLTDTVNDFAGIIDARTRQELDRRIRALQRATGDVVAVATGPTIDPYASIDEFAVRMFENGGRGIGEKGKDNGALVVVAVKERAVRIEVGYDLEEFITDGYAGETIRQVITPAFRSGQFGEGLLAGTSRII